MNDAVRRSSRLPGFYRLSPEERRDTLVAAGHMTPEQATILADPDEGLSVETADKMIENVIGRFALPVGLGANFLINGRDYLVPMVVEEPSIVAAVSHAANLVRQSGGFWAQADRSVMTGQVQVLRVPDMDAAHRRLLENRDSILARANAAEPGMQRRGGGAIDLEVRRLDRQSEARPYQAMLVVHLYVDACDAMGANLVNTMCESVAGQVEELTGGVVALRILSNLTDRRRVRAGCRIPVEHLRWQEFEGEQVAEGIVAASEFAEADPFRAATHNKGIMNGIDSVALATGQDWRAIEAGAHSYAAMDGSYGPLARWWMERGELVGEIDVPMAVGIVGGPIRLHRTVQTNLALTGIGSARELACLMGAVGLAQNLAAIKALGSTGIQRGHMALHARSVAATAGATSDEVEAVAQLLVRSGNIKVDEAQRLLHEFRMGCLDK